MSHCLRINILKVDTVIVNGEVVTETGIEPLSVAIQDGTIIGLFAHGAEPDAHKVIDAVGKLVLPGAIDIHFHCRAPADPQRCDFAT